MNLQLDAGNSRIKWRLIERFEETAEKVASGVVLALDPAPLGLEALREQLGQLPARNISSVTVAEVRGQCFREALKALLSDQGYRQVEFARVIDGCSGLTCGYQEPESMGIDRWLALLAAYRDSGKKPCCIVDCGSTITIDLVGDMGVHQGGYIVPGLNLMRGSMGSKSTALELDQTSDWAVTGPGRSTREAVDNGIMRMVMSLLENIFSEYDAAGFNWYLTGGDSEVITGHIQWPHRLVPELVLDGLTIAFDPLLQ